MNAEAKFYIDVDHDAKKQTTHACNYSDGNVRTDGNVWSNAVTCPMQRLEQRGEMLERRLPDNRIDGAHLPDDGNVCRNYCVRVGWLVG